MDTPVLSSTFLLTLLLAVGLFFFIRASVKDRTQVVTFVADIPPDSLVGQLKQHFMQRAYHLKEVAGSEADQAVFVGVVRPSIFLTIFLTLLASVGILCLALVLSYLFEGISGTVFYGLVLLAPLAGVFYWQRAQRPETVRLRWNAQSSTPPGQSTVTVTAHRDEVLALQKALSQLKPAE